MKHSILILIIVLSIYIFFSGRLNFIFPTHPANYFNHLTYSFLQGRFNLINTVWTSDLSPFNGKLYMYWGPTPILVIAPFVLLFGINFSDALYTTIIGSFSALFFYLLLNQLNKLKITNLSTLKKYLLCLFFAFGTVHFYLSVYGSIWFTSQIISTLYAIFALYVIFLYLNSKKTLYLLSSSFFLGLAIWGRSSFILYIPLFTALIFISCQGLKNSLKIFLIRYSYLFIILSLFLIVAGIYNFQRFGSFLENGYSYHNYGAKFASNKSTHGFLNIAYIPHNFYYMFINTPKVLNKFPFFDFDREGNSFLTLSPLFFLVFMVINKKYWLNQKLLINLSLIFCVLSIIFFQLLFWGTGWLQFGYRYSLDIIPLLIILLSQVISNVSLKILVILVSISILLNTLGTLWFLKM